MDAVIYYLPGPNGFDNLMNEIKEKVEIFAAIFPDAGPLVEALLRGVSDTLDDLVDDDLGGAS